MNESNLTGSDVLDTLGVNGTSQDGGGSSTISSNFVGLVGNILDKTVSGTDSPCIRRFEQFGRSRQTDSPSTQVLEPVLENDSLGNCDSV